MKTVLITGASSGIGKETAIVFAQNKYNLVLVARRKDKLEEVKRQTEQEYGIQTTIIEMNLSELDSSDKLFTKIQEQNIKIDILINNAGYGLGGNFIDIDIKQETEMLMLNMITLTKLTKLFAQEMNKAQGGTIINIASTASFQPIPSMACYGATKAYVLHFSQAIAYELRKTKVKILAICPGATQSEFSKVAGVENAALFKSAPSSLDLANFIFKSLDTKKYYKIHGFKNRFLKSMSVIMPNKLVMMVTEKLMK